MYTKMCRHAYYITIDSIKSRHSLKLHESELVTSILWQIHLLEYCSVIKCMFSKTC